MDHVNVYRPNLKFVALPLPETIAIAVLGWVGCEPPILGKGVVPFERALVPIGPP